MTRLFIICGFALVVLSSCTHTYYIVRHAEKISPVANASTDVPLSNQGQQRAEALKEILKDKKIRYVFATNTIRAKSTAQPTADYFHVTTEIYGPKPDSAFIRLLRSKKKNVLVVGHSNTVDDIVNLLCGKKNVPADLPDTEYSKLFAIRIKGGKVFFSESSIPSAIIADPKF